ncbi:hypothetical protein N9K26_00115 [Flavobacteriales bacterium]|nr:hypothetical protein [Flavobacteriales bacterium]MDA9775630.1 hypothetical protein [Flavobacteriales bacterium]
MYSEILDDDSEDKVVHTKFVWKPRLVLGILWAIVIWRFVDGNYYSLKFIWGAVGLSVATYYLVINSSISLYATFILLGLGILGVINHFSSTYYFSIGSFSLNINYFGLLTLHAILNADKWVEVLKTLLGAKSRKGASKEKPIFQNRFISKFKSKTDDELKRIIESPQYSKEAIDAAKELLKRRAK